ncbi:MAG: hypothetical protein OWT28_13090 [Firmicutes bacterium]|nr:hypothetical protein [Bacillota bacterium]
MNKPQATSRVLWLLVLLISVSLAVTWLMPDFRNEPEMTPWIIARASGVTAFVLLTLLTLLGLVMASVPNREQWRATRILLPLHRLLSLYLIGFIAVHVVSITLDAFAHVGIEAIFVPMMSGYRPVFVSLGTLALYAIVLLAVTARFPRLLPSGRWLTVHRVALITFVLTLLHGVLTGSDTPSLRWLYEISAFLVALMSLIRYAIIGHKRAPKPS